MESYDSASRAPVRFYARRRLYSLMLLRTISLSLCTFSLWAGSSANVAGTVTGFVYDAQENAIRPMLGIPSAARLGAPVVSDVTVASVSPTGSLAIAVEGRHLMLYRNLG